MSRLPITYLLVPLAANLLVGCTTIRSTSNYAAPTDPPPAAAPAVTAPTPALPSAAAPPTFGPAETYVYVIDGVNPLGLAGTRGMADRIRASGYPNTRFGGWFRAGQFEREIRAVHAQNPAAQFVIIGYSAGAYPARITANRLVRDGVPVAMVGYVGGDYLRDTAETRPAGAAVVNVRGNGYLLTGRNLLFNGTDVTGADNVNLRGTRHYDLPKQQATVDAIVGRLNSVSAYSPSAGYSPVVGSAPAVGSVPAALAGAVPNTIVRQSR